jgi:glucose/arabinose dehydrogenase
MAVLKGQQLRVVRLSSTGLSVVSQTVRVTGHGRLRSAVLNPANNYLYVATDADPGRILRVAPS